jgi:hypothetical protein
MANNIQLYHIGPIEFPSLDINSVEGKWAADFVAHERQQIKRNRLMQDMLETGLWEEMTAACLVLMDMVYNYSKRILLFKCGVAGARQNLHT